MKKRFSEEQIIGFLREADKGMAVKELCRKHGFSDASYYLWRSKYGGMDVSDAKRLKALEAENARLKRLLADAMLENEVTKEALTKKMVAAPARRELVRWMGTRGLSERRCLGVVGMSASSFRYQPRPDRERGAAGSDRGPGAASPTLRLADDLLEAQAGWRADQPQARRTALRA